MNTYTHTSGNEKTPNAPYVCSQYYRAPELTFRATDYTSDIGR